MLRRLTQFGGTKFLRRDRVGAASWTEVQLCTQSTVVNLFRKVKRLRMELTRKAQ